jgi:hypothetical protein
VSKKSSNLNDIVIPEHDFQVKWNLASDGNTWIISPESVSEIGCIHTCQGLEVDYIGVIVGSDLVVRDGRIVADPSKRAKTDKSLYGYRKAYKDNPDEASRKAGSIIKNTYRTLMTRGLKGCYVYFVDKETEAFFKVNLGAKAGDLKFSDIIKDEKSEVNKIISELPEELKFKDYLPVMDLEAVATNFGKEAYVQEDPKGWMKVELPRAWDKDFFVAKVVGKSMEPTISDGSYCVFRFDKGGTRNGLVVIVECHSILDPETSRQFTIKRYKSEKEYFSDGTWRHKIIILSPDNKDFKDIVLTDVPAVEFRVVAELVAIL